MRDINTPEDILTLCKALSSPARLQILKLIAERKQINLNELAEALEITNGAITQHMKPLLDADLIEFTYASGKRGSQKICSLKEHKFMIDILSDFDNTCMYQVEIPVGNFTEYKVFPTCGIATRTALIGEVDEPRYFDDPETKEAGILWFTKGYVEYRLPNYLKKNQTLEELQISMEISSEAPGRLLELAERHLFLDQRKGPRLLDESPAISAGTTHGIFTPDWWDGQWNSYGLLKLLTITHEGTYVDGGKISDANIDSLAIDSESTIKFRIAVPDTAANVGGATLFGKGFGNYNQDIKVRAIFKET